MRLKNVVLACAVVTAMPGYGQGSADPLTGTWTGEMGQSAAQQRAVTVEMRLSGNNVSGVITGTGLTPGDFTGTFDAATGAVKMDVVVRGDGFKVTLEGKLESGSISGRVILPDQTGAFKITKGAPGAESASGATAAAPRPRTAADTAAAHVRQAFTQASGWLARAAELVPADKYSYRPVATVRTLGELIGHVADSYNYYCGRAAGRSVQWTDAIEKGTKDKAGLAQKLKQAGDACTAAYAGTGQIGPLVENVGHTSLHYGNVITYMRMLGLTPPSS